MVRDAASTLFSFTSFLKFINAQVRVTYIFLTFKIQCTFGFYFYQMIMGLSFVMDLKKAKIDLQTGTTRWFLYTKNISGYLTNYFLVIKSRGLELIMRLIFEVVS